MSPSQPTPPPAEYIPVDAIAPQVDFVSYWRVSASTRHVYVVPSHHFLLVEAGTVVATNAGRQFTAGPRDLLWFGPTHRNEWGHPGPLAVYQMHVAFAAPPRNRAMPLLEGMDRLPVVLPTGEAFGPLRAAFETVCMNLPQPHAVHRLRVQAAVLDLLALIAGLRGRQPRHELITPWERARLSLIVTGPGAVKVEDLAHSLAMSAQHFTRCFKYRFGIGPKAYQMAARMREAAHLLRHTDQSIKAIAYTLGFRDPKSFTRAFHKQLGVQPTQMRLIPQTREPAPAVTPNVLFPVNVHLLPPGTNQEFLANTFHSRQRPFTQRRPSDSSAHARTHRAT
jgi:AraC-like DNA-binding protein